MSQNFLEKAPKRRVGRDSRNKTRGREGAGCFAFSFGCLIIVNVLWLVLTVPWVGLQFVIVVFPDHILLFYSVCFPCKNILAEIKFSTC